MPSARMQGRPRLAWVDKMNTLTGLPMEESIRMTEINGESTSMVSPTLGSRMAKEQNSTVFICSKSNKMIGVVNNDRGTGLIL